MDYQIIIGLTAFLLATIVSVMPGNVYGKNLSKSKIAFFIASILTGTIYFTIDYRDSKDDSIKLEYCSKKSDTCNYKIDSVLSLNRSIISHSKTRDSLLELSLNKFGLTLYTQGDSIIVVDQSGNNSINNVNGENNIKKSNSNNNNFYNVDQVNQNYTY